MASYQQLIYCKKCKKNVSVNEKGQCLSCQSTQLRKSWTVRFRFVEQNGIEVHKRLTGFATKKEAQNGYIDFVNTSKLQRPIEEGEKLSFVKLYEEYKAYTKSRIKESSYYDFCSKSDLHILPYFKNLFVEEITPKILLEWQNKLDGFSYRYKFCIRSYLKAILNYADKYYDIPNKLNKVDSFRNVEMRQEMLFWTPEEFNAFIKKVSREEYRAFFYALYYTGARKGEILATTWSDWDLNNGYLNITKSITKKVFNTPWAITNPKNESSIRKISLPRLLIDIMKQYKIGRENYKFVFSQDKPLADSNIERVQKEACELAEVKKIRLHDFRHSHASLLISGGASIVAVAKRLGHSNIEQTLNTYAHMMPDEDQILLKILENKSQKY